MKERIKLGLPKGSLQETTFSLLDRAGWRFTLSQRSYKPYCDDPEVEALMIRAQEISLYVEQVKTCLANKEIPVRIGKTQSNLDRIRPGINACNHPECGNGRGFNAGSYEQRKSRHING